MKSWYLHFHSPLLHAIQKASLALSVMLRHARVVKKYFYVLFFFFFFLGGGGGGRDWMEGCEQVSDSSPQISHAFNSLFVPGQNDLLFTVTTSRLFKKTSHKSFKGFKNSSCKLFLWLCLQYPLRERHCPGSNCKVALNMNTMLDVSEARARNASFTCITFEEQYYWWPMVSGKSGIPVSIAVL